MIIREKKETLYTELLLSKEKTHIKDNLYDTNVLFTTDFPSHKCRVRHQWNFNSVIAESTYE